MKLRIACVVAGFLSLILSLAPLTVAQTTAETAPALPHLVRFGGAVKDLNGNALTGVVGITFALYSEQTGGPALWLETQNVTADNNGHYVALLGSTTPDGLPAEIFTSEQARWVGVQVSGQAEQPRVLLVSAPYALKAGDAETIGGLPPSAFVLANQGTASGAKIASAPASASAQKNSAPPANPDVTGKGVVDYIPMWDTTSDIIDSIIFQKSSEIGINTTTPAALLDVNGKADVRDTLTLYPKSTDNTLAVNGTSFKVSSTGEVTFISGQTFPGTGTITGITTASGSGLSGGGTKGTLSLKVPSAGITNAMLANPKITLNASAAGGLTVPGAMTLGDTYTIGLKTCSANQVLQYVGTAWACSNAGTGTVTSVASGSGLTGGPITTSGTLSIASGGVTNAMLANSKITLNSGTGITAPGAMTLGDTYTVSINTSVVPQLAAANSFIFPQSISASNPLVAALQVTNSDQGIMATGGTVGVEGFSSGSTPGYGVLGTAAALSGSPIGVYGWGESSPTAIGVFGQNETESTTAGLLPVLGGGGVWGDGGSGTKNFGVIGTVDDGYAGYFANNSSSGFPGLAVLSIGGSDAVEVVALHGSCSIDVNANLSCTGTKNAVVPIDGGKRIVAMSAIESPQNWFEDAGESEMVHGTAVVQMDSAYTQTVNTDMKYQVFLTPYGDCKGLYVTNRTANSFEVRELGGGTASLSFGYRIMALRRKYENVRFADHTADMERQKRMLARAHAAGATNQQSHMPTKKLSPARPLTKTTALK